MKETRSLFSVLVVLICVGLLAAIAIPNFIVEPDTSPKNSCINNLRLIDGAIQQWALENNKTNTDAPTWKDLQRFLSRGADGPLPKCPSDGTYTIGTVKDIPTCSIPGHVLPQ